VQYSIVNEMIYGIMSQKLN